jgi:chemotaxis methyl-accepting protein methylase
MNERMNKEQRYFERAEIKIRTISKRASLITFSSHDAIKKTPTKIQFDKSKVKLKVGS